MCIPIICKLQGRPFTVTADMLNSRLPDQGELAGRSAELTAQIKQEMDDAGRMCPRCNNGEYSLA